MSGTKPTSPRGTVEAPYTLCRTRTATASIDGHRVHLAVADYPDGRPCRIRVDVHKEGSGYRGMMEAFARTVSHGLQHGVPLSVYVEDWKGCSFEPNGATDDTEVPTATSILDWIARTLEAEYPEHARVAQPAEAPPVAAALPVAAE
jgi:ribonucleoside-diphosphate reductase alpha chain